MRNLATCYNDHAVKVSDSYCSAYPNRSYLSPRPTPTPSTLNAVVSTYKVKLPPHKHLFVRITWPAKLLCRGFFVSVSDKPGSTKPVHRMSAEKGEEVFGACGCTVRVRWDLTKARFEGPGPEPVASFYVVVLVDSCLALLLGDMGAAELSAGLSAAKTSLVSQCEQITGSTQFSTRARFSESGEAHEVVIRCGADVDARDEEGPRAVGPVLSVLIDKRRVLRVRRLKWNFRGNQLVFVDGLMVDVMWDLHRWMKEERGGGRSTVGDGGYDGVFMFRTRSGLDSRLWLEEKKLSEENNHEKPEFSFLLCVTKTP